jgi:DNA polymerase elongation subunit (family B)
VCPQRRALYADCITTLRRERKEKKKDKKENRKKEKKEIA